MTLATKITFFRILLIPVILFFMAGSSYFQLVAAILFVVASATDWLDGYVARKYNQVSVLGKFLDPLADKLLVLGILIVFVEAGVLMSIPVVIIVFREIIVTGVRLIAAGKGTVIAASVLAKYKTTAQMVAVAMMLFGIPFSLEVFWVSVFLTVISGIDYIVKNKEVFVDEK